MTQLPDGAGGFERKNHGHPRYPTSSDFKMTRGASKLMNVVIR